MLHHRLLGYLDEVARSGSIRRAATRLNVASSAVNRQILSLEEEMGTPNSMALCLFSSPSFVADIFSMV